MSYFHNKRIWVTGASSGIGRSVAIKLSKLGAEVILTARNRDKLEEVKKECGNAKAHIFDHDLSNLESIDDLVDSCLLYTSPSPRDRQKSRMPSSA